jgi:ketosteroid isomerase-like protein
MRIAVFCFVVLLSSCTTAPPDTREADAKAIKDIESAAVKTASAKKLDEFVAFYADDASVLIANAPLFTGKAAIKDGLKPIMDDPNFTLSSTVNKVEVSKSGDLAYTQGTYKMTFSDMRGNKFDDEGKYLTVWRKLADGSWKMVQDTFMTDLPLPPPPA